ncbi:MAG TPA: DUF433 domain-containing protein [Fimbriimonadaceae bacterium]|jgi:uncharacterized protein (DUF433 family)
MKIEEAVWKDAGRMSGALCFRNTRIPVSTLFFHLEAGQMSEFYRDFPDVTPEMAAAVLEASHELLELKFGGPAAA